MTIYTIGFTKKDAREFFRKIEESGADLLIDIRLNNSGQLAGFTKEKDLEYFLEGLCGCAYAHDIDMAPTKEILDAYKKYGGSWDNYVKSFDRLMDARKTSELFMKRYGGHEKVVLLCSETTPEHCHRRLVAERVAKDNPHTTIIHI